VNLTSNESKPSKAAIGGFAYFLVKEEQIRRESFSATGSGGFDAQYESKRRAGRRTCAREIGAPLSEEPHFRAAFVAQAKSVACPGATHRELIDTFYLPQLAPRAA
jgi:hypothetical protein